MAEAEDPTPAGATSNGGHRRRAREEDLETQVQHLRDDIKSISNTLTRLGQSTVKDVQKSARQRAQDLADRGQSMIEEAQGEIGSLERQLKDTIRDRPLTAVAGAVALGFLIAVMTR
jgi:ElaB/YqjD/DUF883 family membrane-anchored ribosome-binding protein